MEHKLHMNNHVSDTGSGEPLVFRGIDNFLFTYLFENSIFLLFFSIFTQSIAVHLSLQKYLRLNLDQFNPQYIFH